MTMSLVFESKNWDLERGGKMHYKQDQVFHLNKLSILLIESAHQKLRFWTRKELEHLLATAECSDLSAVQTQLAAVRSVMPFYWEELATV